MERVSTLGRNDNQKNITIYNVLDEMARILYDTYSGDYIIRGSYAIRNYLLNVNHAELVRTTTDIDLYWISRPTLTKIANEFHEILSEKSDLSLRYEKIAERGRHNDFQTGRLFYHVTGEDADYNVNIDLHYMSTANRKEIQSGVENTLYVSPTTIIADKVSISASEVIKERIHDLYDIYVLSNYFDFNLQKVSELCRGRVTRIGEAIFILRSDVYNELKQRYDNNAKLHSLLVEFEDVFNRTIEFTTAIYTYIFNGGNNKHWQPDKSRWL